MSREDFEATSAECAAAWDNVRIPGDKFFHELPTNMQVLAMQCFARGRASIEVMTQTPPISAEQVEALIAELLQSAHNIADQFGPDAFKHTPQYRGAEFIRTAAASIPASRGVETEEIPRLNTEVSKLKHAVRERADVSIRLSRRLLPLQAKAATAAEVSRELLATLRREAPGTPLNNHKFDQLGIRANDAIRALDDILGLEPAASPALPVQEQEQEIERLTFERDHLLAWFDGLTPAEMHDAIVRDKTRIAKLEAALKPFAHAADDAERVVGHDGPMGQYLDYSTLCAARAALGDTP